MSLTRRFIVPVLLVVFAVIVAAAQTRSGLPASETGLGYGAMPPERSGFTFCRLMYRSVVQEQLGSGWVTDYPSADQNLMIRLAELTLTGVTKGQLGEPLHAVVRATDRNVFQCPFLFASDVGTIEFLDDEVIGLREYLLKGGFLWVDDFWGSTAWNRWVSEIGRVLPEYVIEELPPDHPIFATFFRVQEIPQIPAISFWLSTGGQTSERGGASADPKIYGIFDEHGRLLVLMSHNTDIADGWEREGADEDFFHRFSPLGYAVGVNVVIWSLTH